MITIYICEFILLKQNKLLSLKMELNEYMPSNLQFNPTTAGNYINILDTNGQEYSLSRTDFDRLMNIIAVIQDNHPEIYQEIIRTNFRVISRQGFDIIPYKFNQLSGAISFSYLTSQLYNMRVILIGDYHYNNTTDICAQCSYNCPDYVPQFLDTIIKATNAPVDFFFEYSYIKGAKSIEKSARYNTGLGEESYHTISDTALFFNKCLQINKQECREEYPNLRLHYADYRDVEYGIAEKLMTVINEISVTLSRYNLLDIDNFEMLKQVLTRLEEIEPNQYEDIKNDILYLLSQIRELKLPTKTSDVYDMYIGIIESTKIKKQLENIPDSRLQNLIRSFIIENLNYRLEENDSNIKIPEGMNLYTFLLTKRLTILPKLDLVNPPFLARMIVALNLFFNRLILINTIIMDSYLLGRLFRTYKDAPPATNVIIYAGDIHIKTYQRFLVDELDFEFTEPLKTAFSNRQMCLDLTGVEQPFFI